MDLPEKLSKFSEEYSNDGWFRAAVSGIPIIGSSLDTLISTYGQKIIQKRTEQLIHDLKEEIANLKESKLNRDYILSEEFLDLFKLALQVTINTRQKEKIRLYAQILKGTIQNPTETENSEAYLYSLVKLSLRDIMVAKVLYEQQKEIPYEFDSNEVNDLQYVWGHGWNDLPAKTNLQWDELLIILDNLRQAGLITEITGGYVDYIGGVFKITPKFKKMMTTIN